jgi:hypothetical protein
LTSREGVQIDRPQTIARVFGVLFLITFITSIPAYFFYVPVLDDPRYILGAGADTRVSFGAFLELVLNHKRIPAKLIPPIGRRVRDEVSCVQVDGLSSHEHEGVPLIA